MEIVDFKGKVVKVGSRVRYYDENPTDVGEVVEITDWDGDVDDDTGRSIAIAPSVKVRYSDGGIESFESFKTSEWEFDWAPSQDPDDYPERIPSFGKVEELMVVE